MYLVAHDVRRPSTGQEGINAYCYLHGPYTWEVPPPGIPDQDPGTLTASRLDVQPPAGNRVRGYLDIVAPDETPTDEIRTNFVRFVAQARGNPLPWIGISGRCLFRFSLDGELAQSWHLHLAQLYHAATAARVGG